LQWLIRCLYRFSGKEKEIKMKTNRPFKLFSLLVVAALLLAACGGPATQEAPPAATQAPVATEAPAAPEAPAATQPPQAGETKEVVVWGFVWTADWLDAIAPDFEAAHPGVKVKVERFEYDPYQDMVLTTLASGEGVPDVVTLDPMWAGDLIRGETVLPLDKATSELNVSDFVPGGWNLYGWKGVQYGIPLDLDFNLLFYRKDVYEKAMQTLGMTELPTNTQDFLKVADQVVKDTGKPAVIQFQGDYYAWYQSFLAPMGGNLISDDSTQYVFNSDAAVKALELYSDLANKHKVGKLWDFDTDGDPMVALQNSEANGIMYGSWFATELASGAPDMAGKWGIAPLPWGDAGRKYDAATGGACLSIPTGAKEPDLAWEFIKFSMSAENQVKYFQIVSGVPSLKTSWTDPAFDEVNEYFGIPLGRSVADWSLRVLPMQLPSMEVSDLIGEAIQKATTGQASAKDALDEAVSTAPPLE
jgi:lactose/L-arabinose transport system substrate-binding protein